VAPVLTYLFFSESISRWSKKWLSGQPPALKISVWTPSMTAHPHFKHWSQY